jgi:hypothetical protein
MADGSDPHIRVEATLNTDVSKDWLPRSHASICAARDWA